VCLNYSDVYGLEGYTQNIFSLQNPMNYVLKDNVNKCISLVLVQRFEFIKVTSLADKSLSTGALKYQSP